MAMAGHHVGAECFYQGIQGNQTFWSSSRNIKLSKKSIKTRENALKCSKTAQTFRSSEFHSAKKHTLLDRCDWGSTFNDILIQPTFFETMVIKCRVLPETLFCRIKIANLRREPQSTLCARKEFWSTEKEDSRVKLREACAHSALSTYSLISEADFESNHHQNRK